MMKFLDRQTVITIHVAAIAAVFWFVQFVSKNIEPDPLTVELATEVEEFKLKIGEEFNFNRAVCINKDLAIDVHREFHNVDTGKKYMLHTVRYVAYAEDGCFESEFSAYVPDRIPAGNYEYRPILIYDVNTHRTVTKPAPIVRVEVIDGRYINKEL